MAGGNPDDVIGVLVSGGLDSCILISELLRRGRSVQPIFVRGGLVWEQLEIQALRRYLQYEPSAALRELVELHLPMADLLGEHWSLTGTDAPLRGAPEHEVFLPGRNALLSVKAGVWCQLHGVSELALGTLVTSPFADAKPVFFDHVQALLDCYTDHRIRVTLPFGGMDKTQVMQLGREKPLQLTFSCIAPVEGRHCGRCNKCAERRRAFRDSGLVDTTRYEHQTDAWDDSSEVSGWKKKK